MNLYKHLVGLALRVTPSVSSFLLLLCIDFFVTNEGQKLWALDFVLIYPILMPFFRMGAPLHIMEQGTTFKQQKLGIYRGIQTIAAAALYIMLILGIQKSYFSIAILSVIGALLFNNGYKKIRYGNHFGYLLQNVIIYLFVSVMLIAKQDVYSSITIIIPAVLLYLFISEKRIITHLRTELLTRKNFRINYVGDVANSFVVPILLYFSYKVGNESDPALIFVLKITGFISGTVGGLIILNIKKLDKSVREKNILNLFRKLKKELLYIYLILAALSNIAVIILYPKYATAALCLTVFEGLILFLGQYNTIIIFMKKKRQSVLSNTLTIIFIIGLFTLTTSSCVSINLFLFYVIGASIYQVTSYLAYKYY